MAIDDLSALETRPALSRSRRHPPITIKRWPGAAAACLISPTVAADTEPHLRCLPPASVNRQRSYAAIQGTDAESCCAVGDLNVSEMLAALPFERTMRPSVLAPGHGFFLRSDLRPAAPVSTQSGRAVVQIMFFWNFFVPRMVDGTVGFDLAFGFTDSKSWPQRAGSRFNDSTRAITAC